MLIIAFILIAATAIIVAMHYHYKKIIEIKLHTIEQTQLIFKLRDKREARLIYINQSIKKYINEQQTNIKAEAIRIANMNPKQLITAGRYIELKNIEKKINELENLN